MDGKLFALEIGENFIIYDCRVKRHRKENIIMLYKGNDFITILDFKKARFKLTGKGYGGDCIYKLIDKK